MDMSMKNWLLYDSMMKAAVEAPWGNRWSVEVQAVVIYENIDDGVKAMGAIPGGIAEAEVLVEQSPETFKGYQYGVYWRNRDGTVEHVLDYPATEQGLEAAIRAAAALWTTLAVQHGARKAAARLASIATGDPMTGVE